MKASVRALSFSLLTIFVSLAPLVTVAAPPTGFAIVADPACPSPADELEVIVVPIGGWGLVGEVPLAVRLEGNTIAVIAEATGSFFPETPGYVVAKLPALPLGGYRMDFYTRVRDLSNTLGPEQFADSSQFEVVAQPGACEASRIVATSPFLTTTAGTSYPAPLQFRVTDAHGFPVAGVSVTLARIAAPDETPNVAPPDIRNPIKSGVSDADGLVTVPAAANDVVGAFTYVAYFIYARSLGRLAYVTFYNAPAQSMRPTYPLVEYRRDIPGNQPHFFMTGYNDEMLKLDRSRDWRRTGAVLMTFPPGYVPPTVEPPCITCAPDFSGPQPACRFYGRPEAGIDSHFFSNLIGECGYVATAWKESWSLETSDAFRAYMPNIIGECPVGTRPAYRAYNNQPDVNHRYALTPAIAAENGGKVWLNEGFGSPTGPFMCLPQ